MFEEKSFLEGEGVLEEQELSRENYIDSLRRELLYLIEKKLTPLALKYQYSHVPLESRVKWKPMVLVLGNYSSGKSTLINDFLGSSVQVAGQAPTDDAFTVITCDEDVEGLVDLPEGTVYEERDGNVLLNDEQYPFESLRKYGENFSAHFRLKKVKTNKLRNLVLVDTPGMLDAASDSSRAYDYQGVLGDLAMISDLILVLFDPHKAGTIKESHLSIRETLPNKTLDDRVVFVLNRVDECTNLEDLLRVYGNLCWNLSAITGRKDMPRILLSYSSSEAKRSSTDQIFESKNEKDFLSLIENQRHELVRLMTEAPRYRLDHLVSFVEAHSRRMGCFLDELLSFRSSQRSFLVRWSVLGLGASLVMGALLGLYLYWEMPTEIVATMERVALLAGGAALVFFLSFYFIFLRMMKRRRRKHWLASLSEERILSELQQQESWEHIHPKLLHFLKTGLDRRTSLTALRKELESIDAVHSKGAKEIRGAINSIYSFRKS